MERLGLFTIIFGVIFVTAAHFPFANTIRAPTAICPRAFSWSDATVDLHSHLFMDEGMGVLFHGKFDGPLRARNYKSRFDSEVDPEALDCSNIGVVVASLYASAPFVRSVSNSIRAQITTAENFVNTHPNWIIAKNSREARTGIANNKRIIILSLEGAYPVLTKDSVKEFIDEKGIRIVTFIHLADTKYGGAAFLRGYHKFSNPFQTVSQFFHPLKNENVQVNRNGLTEQGREIAELLIQHKVWIDLTHASDASQGDLKKLILKHHQPLLYTHAFLRKYYHSERAMTDVQIQDVRDSAGVIGIIPSLEMLEGTDVQSKYCPDSCAHCDRSLGAVAEQFEEFSKIMPVSSLMLGSDFNGGIPHLAPSCGTGTSLDDSGLWNIGQVDEFWSGLEKLGAPLAHPRRAMLDTFLDAWERAENPT